MLLSCSCHWASPFLKPNIQSYAIAFDWHVGDVMLIFRVLELLLDLFVEAVLNGEGFFEFCAVSFNFFRGRDLFVVIVVLLGSGGDFDIWIKLRTYKIIQLLQRSQLPYTNLPRLQRTLPPCRWRRDFVIRFFSIYSWSQFTWLIYACIVILTFSLQRASSSW